MGCCGKRRFERAHDQSAHKAAVAEAHFRFCRMHVHVDEIGVAIDEQGERGVTVARKEIRVGAADSTQKKTVAHRASVHEQKLQLRRGAVVGGQSRKARDANPFARRIYGNGVFRKLAADDARKTLQPSAEKVTFAGIVERAPAIGGKNKCNVGARHRQTF